MTTKDTKAQEVAMTPDATEIEVEGSAPDTATDTGEEVVDETPKPKKAEVTGKQMLLNGLLSNLEIGVIYEFTYQGKTLATADSTKVGAVTITLVPSKWATEIAHNLWEYELDEALSVDPTTIDPLADGWSCVLITDVMTYEAEETEEESEEESEDTSTEEATPAE